MPQSVAELVDLLDLEEIEIGLFRARQPDTQLQRVFGGQVLAQALIAAARTVAVTRVLHSLHAYFLSPDGPTSRSCTTWRPSATADPSPPAGWWPGRADG